MARVHACDLAVGLSAGGGAGVREVTETGGIPATLCRRPRWRRLGGHCLHWVSGLVWVSG